MRLEPNFFAEISIWEFFIFYINGYNKDAHIDVYTLDPSYPWSYFIYT